MALWLAFFGSAFADPPRVVGVDVPRPPAPPDRGPLPVVGGSDVDDPDDWPDVAAVSDGRNVFCTGTLIAPDVVLTAGHCISSDVEEVVLGTNDFGDPGEVIGVDDAIEYPNWEDGSFDVGVLILEESSSIRPRTIATDCVREDIENGAEVVMVGYGALDPNGQRYTDDLQEGETEIDAAECDTEWLGCARDIMPDGELTAGYVGAGACYGDSGGPLYLPTDRGTFVVGVASRVAAPCGNGGIWVRPDHPDLFEWIEDVTDRTLPRPLCLDATAPTLYFVKNQPGTSQIDVDNVDSPVDFEVVGPPVFGSASVTAAGLVTFVPERGFLGPDEVVVRFRDEEGWVGEVEISIQGVSRGSYRAATGERAPCGCASPAPSGSFVVGLLAALVWRRKRRV